jgi:phosphatidylcholine synthase
VAERIPWFDGSKLDDVVDYLTYVFVPALFVWRAVLVPSQWTIWIAASMLLASGYGFSRKDAKTPDHFFTGFPSYWNVVTFYLLVAGLPAPVNAAILLTFIVLVFIPIRYVYPSRTPIRPVSTNVLGVIWSASILFMLWQYPDVSKLVMWVSLAFPVYYFALSMWLHVQKRDGV